VYKKGGWTESDFLPKGRGGSPGGGGPMGGGVEAPSAGSPVNANSTLNRPMASQGGTRYEDKTLHRTHNSSSNSVPPSHYAQVGWLG